MCNRVISKLCLVQADACSVPACSYQPPAFTWAVPGTVRGDPRDLGWLSPVLPQCLEQSQAPERRNERMSKQTCFQRRLANGMHKPPMTKDVMTCLAKTFC